VQGTQLCIRVPAGAEEIVQGYRRQIIIDSYHGLYWTDRWYNVWRLDRMEGCVFMPMLLYHVNAEPKSVPF